MAQSKITTTVQINNDETNPLNVNADFNVSFDSEDGYDWELSKINFVELAIADKEGIDITKIIFANPRAKALVESMAADCDDQIILAYRERRIAA